MSASESFIYCPGATCTTGKLTFSKCGASSSRTACSFASPGVNFRTSKRASNPASLRNIISFRQKGHLWLTYRTGRNILSVIQNPCASLNERTGPPHRDKTDSLSPERRNQAPGSIRHWCGALLAAPASGSRSSSGEPDGSSEDRGASQDPSSSPAGSDCFRL